MDNAVVKNAIGSLDKLLGNARQALWDIERQEFGVSAYEGEPGGYEDPRGALKSFLEHLYDLLLVVLEAAAMPETRDSLVKEWSGSKNKRLPRRPELRESGPDVSRTIGRGFADKRR
jgi:hypothetical protein